jgi:hypothetical protein
LRALRAGVSGAAARVCARRTARVERPASDDDLDVAVAGLGHGASSLGIKSGGPGYGYCAQTGDSGQARRGRRRRRRAHYMLSRERIWGSSKTQAEADETRRGSHRGRRSLGRARHGGPGSRHRRLSTNTSLPSSSLSAMVRQFKHHEQKLLKKVDFLNVRLPCWTRPTCAEIEDAHSGSKMRTSARSRSCAATTSRTARTTTSVPSTLSF